MTWTMTWRLLIIAITCLAIGAFGVRSKDDDIEGITAPVAGIGLFICLLLIAYWLITWVLS